MTKKIKLQLVFESYHVFYQPYIPPVVQGLGKCKGLEIKILAYKGYPMQGIQILPTYFKRRLFENWYFLKSLFKSPKLQFNEILAIKKGVQIVHLQHSFLFPKVLGLLQLPKTKRPKIIITLRGGDTYVKPWVSKKWRDFYKTKGNQVDAFVVMSEHQKQYLHEKWQIDLDRIYVIPISFGTGIEAKAKYPNSEALKLVSVFRMCWEKNITGNLHVIKQLKAKGLPVHYTIYGDGPDLGQVYYLVDKLDLQDVVEVKGKVPNEEIKKSLRAYDFILQLSLSESFGVSVVEAQSYGLPAIISTSDGLPEAISPNESGYCVDSQDSEQAASYIEKLWQNKEQYLQFSEAGISHASTNFTVKNEVKRLLTLYEKLSV